MSVINNNQLAGASGQGGSGYEISKSLRFDSGDSSYLSKTPSSASNQKTWTWSGWVKRSVLDGTGFDVYFCRFIDNNNFAILGTYRDAVDDIGFTVKTSGNNVIRVTTNGLFRDLSAWFHLVCAVDTTAATASDRVKIYINGVLQTSLNSSTYGNQNTDTHINSAGEHRIGANNSYYTNGYLADVHFVDGVSGLTASDFGEYDDNNVWVAKQYTGSYGTNGFHLDFNDTSSNSALGTDAAGSNDWTVHNFSSASTAPVAKSSISYAIAPTDFPGTATNNQSSLSFNNTWDVGASLTTGSYIIIDTGAKGHTVDLTPSSSDASNSYSDDLINWTTGASSTANSSYNEGRYYWIQSAPSGYGGGLTLTSASTADGDSTIDTPMNLEADSGNNPGNYATMNPVGRTDSVYFTEDGNLTCGNSSVSSKSSGSRGYIPSTIGFKSGKWYCEVRTTAASDGDVDFAVGIYPATSTGYYSTSGHYAIRPTGHIYSPSGTHQSYGSTWTDTDTIGIAVDMDSSTKTVQFFKNGSSMASATTIADNEYFFGYGSDGGGGSRTYKATWNFGQRSFAYTPPTGYKSLCTTNLPDPTIADGSTAFNAKTYTGTDNSNAITGLGHSPDLLWIKRRSGASGGVIFDQIRGVGTALESANSGADKNNDPPITSFDTDGFTVGGSYSQVNANNETYIAWAWDAGSSTVSNTDGGISSNVRANPSAGCSIVSYTGTGSNGTVGHGLNAAPHMIIVKNRSNSYEWGVYHVSIGAGAAQVLSASNNNSVSGTWWASTVPTSSVFSIGTYGAVNQNNSDFIAYCFSPVSQFSSFGKYTGNGSSDGPFVFTGHRPRYLLIKANVSGEDWVVLDTARETFNVQDNVYFPNSHVAEVSNSAYNTDILSNGFKLRGSNPRFNSNNETYYYASFAEHPFKTSRAR